MKFDSVEQAQEYLYSFRKAGVGQKTRGFTFDRVRYLARLVGDPQNHLRVIHVAGTSGKGSTCTVISQVLAQHGFKTGLSISPHLYDVRERMQINNSLITEEKLYQYLAELYPHFEEMKTSEYGMASFYEVMIVFVYYIFWKEGVEYAVMETGAGGRLDATNVATRDDKVAIITKIGLDHMDILGKTLREIAGEKSAIIHKGNIAVTILQRPVAHKVIRTRTKEMGVLLHVVKQNRTFSRIKAYSNKLRFDFSYKKLKLPKLELSLQGLYQVENASIALAAMYETALRDKWVLKEEIIRKTFGSLRTPGRFEELIIEGKRIIIDGAHNPQKMAAFIRSLKKRHPHQMFDFLIGFKKGKDYGKMLKYIVPVANRIYVSQFDLGDQTEDVSAEPAEKVKELLAIKHNFHHVIPVVPSTKAYEEARTAHDNFLVITGSLYLIGELYKHIHAKIEDDPYRTDEQTSL